MQRNDVPKTMSAWQVILALLIAYTVAAFVRHDGDKFVDGTDIKNSSNGTFFWVHTFNLGNLLLLPRPGSTYLNWLYITTLVHAGGNAMNIKHILCLC